MGVAGGPHLVVIKVLGGGVHVAILWVGEGWLEAHVGPVNCRIGIREKDVAMLWSLGSWLATWRPVLQRQIYRSIDWSCRELAVRLLAH